MNKLVKAILCAVLMVAVLAGCSAPAGDQPGETASTPETGAASETQSNGKEVDALVAQQLDSVDISFTGAYYPDLHCYANDAFSLDYVRDEKTCYRQWTDDCQVNDLPLIKAYVELLCAEYGFSLVGEPFYLEDPGYYRIKYEYVLQYAGESHASESAVESEFSDSYGDLIITGYATNKYAETEGERELHSRIDYAKWLIPVDNGIRHGSQGRYETYVGTSFGAGLNRLKDGTFQTTDGRLSVMPGQGLFLVDGTAKTYSAWMEWSHKDEQKRICVENKFGVRQMELHLPITKPVSSGDVFTVNEMNSEGNGEYKSVPNHDTMFAILHGEYYLLPKIGLFGTMSRFNARMMYWNEDEEIAVFYFCAQFTAEPKEIEGLVAVSMSTNSDVGNPADADFVITKNEEVQISGPSEFGAGYNLWTWEYISGSEFSELHDTVAQTCTLIGRKPGTVRIKVTYEYSVKEPDILTGIPGSVQKSRSEEFVILITE